MPTSKVNVTLVGNAGTDAELRYTPSGAAVASFSMAVTDRRLINNEWQDGDTTWYRVNTWRDMAENVAETVTKGMRVIVTGSLGLRTWEKDDGSLGFSLEVTADGVGPDLAFASATVTKADRRFQESEPQESTPAPLGRSARPSTGNRKVAAKPANARASRAAEPQPEEPPY